MNQEKEEITLISSESTPVDINAKALGRSKFIKDFLKDFPEDSITLGTVNYKTLLKIKEYLEHYENSEPKEIRLPLPKKNFKNIVDTWDYNFINLPNETIFEIMLAANFMDIKPLLDLTCAKIASEITGKNSQQIRDLFKMGKDCDIDESDNKVENEIENKKIFLTF